jgi:hypothetical protein
MNEEELRQELEGSRLDAQAACTRVTVRYLPHYTAQTEPAWMSQHPVQAIITCHIAAAPSPPPPAASAASSSPHLIHVAACMPSGYVLLHRDVEEGEPDIEQGCRFDAPLRFFPSLNGLLLAHSAQYVANKEAEVTRKLQVVLAAQQKEEDDEDRLAEPKETAADMQTG